ncbi:diguanylate cyclase [Halomonas sp. McH1-25]|uniref:sensor domain-containing diguanylate cyclase n=1 Tax=unclassified Halomonas TaxID=2609666 RepID=UPI001EF568D5|nr:MULTISPECIES: diguanylate cyclase [unclassified Halomonas]MCG7598789.1 diguanylate cyclase [Halomonas sp. McH1-25]MCP1340752.1 diguanylate cyclase [Halomonas sp. FL8]MCP1359523.1 diguanylate cyclase [Halomonas sp. BBD45]MCP1366146.1 diguanylate cyclase [Halomonas sp. BBD48]
MNFRLSSLRHRFLLALATLFLAAMCALGLIARFIIHPALLEEERTLAASKLDQIERVMESDRHALLLMTKDWATWDDTYAFMQGQRAEYPESNFSLSMFQDMDYQFMLFFATNGSVQWTAGIDPLSGSYASCPGVEGACRWAENMAQRLRPLVRYRPAEGTAYLEITPYPAFVALHPILRTDESGPPQGWLAQVRLLDDEWQAHVENQTELPIELLPALQQDILQGLRLERSDSQQMTVTRPITHVTGSESLLLQSRLPREDFFTQLATFRYTQFWTAGLLVMVIAIVLILLESMVLRPLRQFASFTQKLQLHEDSRPLPRELLDRRDEIGMLAREFQQMLELQRRQTSSLVELSHRDPLTGLANRRLFDQHLSDTLKLTQRRSQPMSLLMIDIDFFKIYNDRLGHPAGDSCLKAIADAMQRQFSQPAQLVARTGGEEFSVILPGISATLAARQANNLRLAIEALGLPHPAGEASAVVTVSIGVGYVSPEQPRSTQELIDAADAALYAAKQTGRNRVSMEGEQTAA